MYQETGEKNQCQDLHAWVVTAARENVAFGSQCCLGDSCVDIQTYGKPQCLPFRDWRRALELFLCAPEINKKEWGDLRRPEESLSSDIYVPSASRTVVLRSWGQ